MPAAATPKGKVFTLVEGPRDIVPLVFDSPHSGTAFPADFRSTVSRDILLQTGDLFVDELYASAVERGAALISAQFPRIYVDPNRSLDDFDAMVAARSAPESNSRGDRTQRGIGLFWTIGPDGTPIYDQPLSVETAQRRIESYWRPYHDALQALVDDRHRRFGAVWHVNCHSMPGTGTKAMGDYGSRRADFIVGDRDGTTCSRAFRDCIVERLRSKGYDVRVNELFRGAEIVRRHGAPAENRHSIQVEMNRMLYMDERKLTRLAGFERFRRDVIDPLIDAVHAHVMQSIA